MKKILTKQIIDCVNIVLVIIVVESLSVFFFFNDTATTEIYTLSLHDALPISAVVYEEDAESGPRPEDSTELPPTVDRGGRFDRKVGANVVARSEEHTSELQSRQYLVCRLLLEKKKNKNKIINYEENTDKTDYRLC